jgi:type III pantothenate kinase
VLDVGNTTIHAGLFAGPRLTDQWRLATHATQTADELGLTLRQFLLMGGHDPAMVEGVAVASVVPPLEGMIRNGVVRATGHTPFFFQPGIHPVMPIVYDAPQEIGADRLANSLAGMRLAGCPLVVVDFGTATTFDVVSARGEYLGGAIAPGIELSLGALFSRTARLPQIEIKPPGRVIGRSTREGMQSGIVHGYAGLVDRLISLLRREIGSRTGVLATGGLAGTIAPYTRTVRRVVPHLTLEGIRLVHHEFQGRRP